MITPLTCQNCGICNDSVAWIQGAYVFINPCDSISYNYYMVSRCPDCLPPQDKYGTYILGGLRTNVVSGWVMKGPGIKEIDAISWSTEVKIKRL